MKLRWCVPLALCAALFSASKSAAQEDDGNEPQLPTTSLSLRFAESPEVGVWRRIGTRGEIGLELAVDFTELERNDFRGFRAMATPALKRHFEDLSRPVAPYFYLGLPMGVLQAHQVFDPGSGEIEAEQSGFTIGVILGMGVEVRPFSRVSVGGHVGIRGFWGRDREERDGQETENLDRGGARLYSSGLRAQLFF